MDIELDELSSRLAEVRVVDVRRPEEYDGTLGSAVAGPLAASIGVAETLYIATGIMLVCQIVVVLQPSGRAIRAPEAALAPVPA